MPRQDVRYVVLIFQRVGVVGKNFDACAKHVKTTQRSLDNVTQHNDPTCSRQKELIADFGESIDALGSKVFVVSHSTPLLVHFVAPKE
tara:strand:- start:2035 stop:2298 length:264 start_codon:yes stop_codon:yes gene_type:complete